MARSGTHSEPAAQRWFGRAGFARVNRPAGASASGFDAHGPGSDLGSLFHRLNNQLGIILAHAELLEVRAGDEATRARAAQVVTSALDALGTVRDIRVHAPFESV